MVKSKIQASYLVKLIVVRQGAFKSTSIHRDRCFENAIELISKILFGASQNGKNRLLFLDF